MFEEVPAPKFQLPADLKLPPHKVVFLNGKSSDFIGNRGKTHLYFRMNSLTLLPGNPRRLAHAQEREFRPLSGTVELLHGLASLVTFLSSLYFPL